MTPTGDSPDKAVSWPGPPSKTWAPGPPKRSSSPPRPLENVSAGVAVQIVGTRPTDQSVVAGGAMQDHPGLQRLDHAGSPF